MENKIKWLMTLAIMLFIINTVYSCKTTQYVPVKEIRTDTLWKSRKDSIKWVEKIHVTDSIRWRDSIATKVDAQGNIIGKDTWHWIEKYHNEKDSTSYYKNKCDSLQKLNSDIRDKPVYVEKQLTKTQKYFLWVGKIASAAIVFLLLLVAIKVGLWAKMKFHL